MKKSFGRRGGRSVPLWAAGLLAACSTWAWGVDSGLVEGPADLPLERFEADSPAYTVTPADVAGCHLTPVVVDANCSGKGLSVELPSGTGRGALQLEWPLAAVKADWSPYRLLMVWFHAPQGSPIENGDLRYRLSVEVQAADGEWYVQHADFVTPEKKGAWQTQRFPLRDGRWQRRSDGQAAVPDFKDLKALRVSLPFAKTPLAYEIAGVGLYRETPLAGSALDETRHCIRDDSLLFDVKLKETPDLAAFPISDKDVFVDRFDAPAPRYATANPPDDPKRLTLMSDDPPPCGGGALKVEMPAAAQPTRVIWKAPSDGAWQGNFEGVALWYQAPKGGRLDMGDAYAGLLKSLNRFSISIVDAKGEAWNYIEPVPQREGAWQLLRFPFAGQWRSKDGGRGVSGPIREISINIGSSPDYATALRLGGIALYKPYAGPKIKAETLRTPDRSATLTVLSTKDPATTQGAYGHLDDYDAAHVEVDSSGRPRIKEQAYAYRLTVEQFPENAVGELTIEARDYWWQIKDSQTIRLEPGKGASRVIERELRLPGSEPGHVNMRAVLRVDGREVYALRWTMTARLPGQDGRLAYFWDKVRRGETATVGLIGGAITVTGGSHSDAYSDTTGKLLDKYARELGGRVRGLIAGVPGTGSKWGVWRVEEQLIDPGMDLLICEFAVNDGSASDPVPADWREQVVGTMEGIVRKTLAKNPRTAIVFVYVSDKLMLNACLQGAIPQSIVAHHQVAKHYGIPEVYLSPVCAQGVAEGVVKSHNLFPDGCHPSALAGRCYGEFLANAIRTAAEWKAPAEPPPVPSPLSAAALDRKHFRKIEPRGNDGFTYNAKVAPWYPSDSWSADKPGAKLTFPVKGARVGLFIGRVSSFRYSGAGCPPTEVKNASSFFMLPPLAGPVDGELTVEALPDDKGKASTHLLRWISEE
jgi:hypothetical protein